MNRISRIFLSIILILVAAVPLSAQSNIGDWQLHPTFDNYIDKIIDTPSKVYMQVPGQFYRSDAAGYELPYSSLFVYDKDAEEFMGYTARNYLNGNIVRYMNYNADKGYLLIVYEDSNIDLLYDDDSVYNIPGMMSAVLTSAKDVNYVTFDAENNRAYVAAKFGYIVINDEKKEIAESHIYNTELTAVGRVGDKLILMTPSAAYQSDINDPHLSMSSFSVIEGITNPKFLMPLTDNSFAYANSELQKAVFNDDDTVTITPLYPGNSISNVHPVPGGKYFLLTGWNAGLLNENGTLQLSGVPAENRSGQFSSSDFNEYWFAMPRKGLASQTYKDKTWTVTRDYAMPDASCVFRSFNFEYSDKYGMLVCNDGPSVVYTLNWLQYWILMSGYKDGEWTNYSPVYHNSPFSVTVLDPHGPTIDPADPDVCWFGTYRNGLFRMNLADPASGDVYSHSGDSSNKNLEGFHALLPSSSWNYCHVTKPGFDKDNTLWICHDTQSVKTDANSLYYWKTDDRLNNNVANFKSVPVQGFISKEHNVMQVLKKSNMIVLANGTWDGPMWVFDHNGTPDDTSDDRSVKFTTIYDQDGNSIPKIYIYGFYEDQETGKVWVCTYNGVFTFNPKDAFDSNFRAQRIKVARNDGTNLADYLLDGIPVYRMAADGANRKWFATGGSGAVLTSSDGSEVIRQLTTDNSYIQSNTVYGVGCDPTSNSVWLGTQFGIAQYYSDATPAQADFDNVLAYPNPVRPDYLGWVTIEGLMDNSLVKIVDASGGLVKELGLSSGGMASWDVTNLEGKRVKTGVYYIVASDSREGGKEAKVSKILVVN